MNEEKSIRIDKFLWAVRVYKTRNIAAGECRRGRILVNNIQAKPSKQVFKGEVITVKKLPVIYTFRVLEPVEKRVSAKLAGNFIEDLTPPEEKQKKLIKARHIFIYREKGLGRPTKKDRRTIDRFNDENNHV